MTTTIHLLRALDFAADRHRMQRRKGPSGAPYINHLIEVVTLLADVGNVDDADVLVAAILHDVVEDTGTTMAEVEGRFGRRAGALVKALSDDKSLPKVERKRLVLEHLGTADESTKAIKLADLCSNVKSLPVDWSRERQREYLDWARRAADLCAGINPALDALFQRRWEATNRVVSEAERGTG